MDEIVADAIRLCVDVLKKRGEYVSGSRVDGAIRLLENELRQIARASNEEAE